MPDLIGVDAVNGNAHRMPDLAESVICGLDVHDRDVEARTEFLDSQPVLIHHFSHRLLLVRLDHEGCHEEHLLDIGLRGRDEAVKDGLVFIDADGLLWLLERVEMSPNVVDADHADDDVGLQVNKVGLPSV